MYTHLSVHWVQLANTNSPAINPTFKKVIIQFLFETFVELLIAGLDCISFNWVYLINWHLSICIYICLYCK